MQSVDALNKDELNRVRQELDDLRIDEMDLNEEDDREYMIIKLNEVNNRLIEKLERLENVVQTTVEKAY